MRILFIIPLLSLSFPLFLSCTSANEKQKPDFMAKPAMTVMTKEVPYSVGDKVMKGYLAVPEGEGPFPGVLVVHEWWGQTEYPRERARQLARQGYMAFAVDMYGDGKTVEHPKDAKAFASKVMKDMANAETLFRAALKTLQTQEKVAPKKIAALGYCFGGAVVLEMARRGVDMQLVASYHGDLTPLVQNPVSPLKTRMLIFNGADDPMVTDEALATTRQKLKAAKVRYKLFNFKNAKHGFTNPAATANGEKFNLPLAYNPRADKVSWAETMKAFKVVFK